MNRVIEALEQKVIFITGATGFLGQPLVEKILRIAPGVKRIYLLIRPKRQLAGQVMTAEERLAKELFQSNIFERLSYYYKDQLKGFLQEKLIAVSGDISKPGLGMDDALRSRLEEEVDIVINSAAAVSFDAPLDEALEVNVLSAGRIATFTSSCQGAMLVHVSTAYVSGVAKNSVPETIYHSASRAEAEQLHPPGKFSDVDREIQHIRKMIERVEAASHEAKLKKALLKEPRKPRRGGKRVSRAEKWESLRKKWVQSRLTEEGMKWARRRGWNDTYTYTKAMGEQMVIRKRNGIPTVIIRPSVIESSLSEPTPGWLDGLRMADPLIVAIGKGRLRSLPLDADVILDLVPVDMVVNALLATIPPAMEEGGLKVYHVATGAKNPVTLGELHRLVYQYFQKNPLLDKRGNPIRVKPLKFPKQSTFRLQHKLKTMPLQTAELTLARLPSFNTTDKVKRKISTAKATYEKLYYYGEIYRPYLNLACSFEVRNTLQLFNSLNEEEKELLNFNIECLNWRHYIQNVHIPGVKKHVLKLDTASTRLASSAALTINALVDNTAERFPNKTAIQMKREGYWQRFTYKDLQLMSRKIGQTFLRMGLQKGNRVVLYSENKPEWGIAYLGATSVGLVVVPLDAQTWHKEVWAVARFTQARALLASEYCLERLNPEGLEENERQDSPVQLLNLDKLCRPFERKEYPRSTRLSPQEREVTEKIEVKPGDPASIIFTNSTAVDPKGVVHSHSNFINNLLGVNYHLPIAPNDQLLSVLPLSHALEFTCGFLMAIYGGATVTYVHSLKPKVILESMQKTGTTCMLGVPTLYALIRDDIERRILRTPKSALKSNLLTTSKQVSLSVERKFGKNIGRQLFGRLHQEFGGQIRLFVSGGSALGEKLYQDFKVLGMPIYEGYGLTETAPVLTVNPLQHSKKGSAGKPLPGVELRIFRPDKEGIGEIVARSPSLMEGYYNNPAATESVMREGWFHTGDLGWVDADGYLYVTGRIKDVIVTGAGKNVYPADLEAIYQSLPTVKEICVLGIKSGLTEDIHAVLTPNGGGPGQRDAAEVKKEVQQEIQKIGKELPSYHRLQHIHVWPEPLPRSESGEVCRETVRGKLLKDLQRDRDRPSQDFPTEVHIERNREDELLRELSRISGVPIAEIKADSHLYSDLGLDSLMTIQFLLFVEDRLGVFISDQVAPALETVGQLLEEIRSQPSARDQRPGSKPTMRARIRSARPYPQRSAADRRLLSSCHWILRVLYKTYFQLELHNQRNFPPGGPFIIATNHASHLDAGAMISAVSAAAGVKEARKLHVLGARDYFFNTPFKSWLFSTFLNLVPVEREETSLAGIRMVKSILSAGESVLIFPEGTRSRTGEIQEFKPGVGLIALELGVPVVPAYIGGTYEALPAGKFFPRRQRIRVFFGPVIRVEPDRSQGARAAADERYRQIAAEVRTAIVELANVSSPE
ncbi:MAG: AMP-binding protein [Acidobacteria bacterium]|nr:AMP-binding protein [Acidobacteriota bacterium]